MHSNKFNQIAVLGTIVLAGLFVTFTTARLAIRAERDSLAERSATIAASFGPDILSGLHGTPEDITVPRYADLKATLARVRRANTDTRFAYVTGRRGDDVFFYADSEDSLSDDYSAPGDTYHEATQELRGSFDSGEAFVEGPVSDRWGTWMSGLAPLRGPRGEVVAVVGIDIDARAYYRAVVFASAVPTLLTLIAVILVAAGYRDARKNEEISRVKSRFLSIASHELRSPLAGVVWGVESLVRHRNKFDDHTQQMLARIHTSLVCMSETVNDILDVSRFNSVVQNRIQREAIDLAELVRSVAGVLSLTGEQRGVSMAFDPSFPEHLPLALDKEKIRRVFANIIGNALKYSKAQGTVTVSYALNNGEHIITVSDEGIGIPSGEQDRIFTMYCRASNAQAHDAHGAGMGLYLTKQLVELHGGRIWFESQEGKGTTVHIALKA